MSRKFLDSAYDYTPADSESRQGAFVPLSVWDYPLIVPGIMGLFPPPDEPKSELEIYRLLGPKAGGMSILSDTDFELTTLLLLCFAISLLIP